MEENRFSVSISERPREFYPQFGFEIFANPKCYGFRINDQAKQTLELSGTVLGGTFVVPDGSDAIVVRLRLRNLTGTQVIALNMGDGVDCWNYETGEIVAALPTEFLNPSKIKDARKEMRARKKEFGVQSFSVSDYNTWRAAHFDDEGGAFPDLPEGWK